MPTVIPPQSILREDSSFTPFFRFLEDFDSFNRHAPVHVDQCLRSFTPKFDMMEMENSFELYGELPGIDKKNMTIDFTEPQTIVIKGSIQRHYEADTPPSGTVSDQSKSHDDTVKEAEEGGKEKEKQSVQKEARKENTTKYWVSERSPGKFSRSFTFPIPINQEAVSASLKDGILKISVPKAEKPASHRIVIN